MKKRNSCVLSADLRVKAIFYQFSPQMAYSSQPELPFRFIVTMQSKQLQVFLKQLELLYPAAFKRNVLLYSQIKTKGILDDKKELIPWALAGMIFVPISLVLKALIETQFAQITAFQAHAYAVLCILLFFMWVVPVIIKQIKHSSSSLYQLLRHTPIKLAAVIVLQALNLAYLQNIFVLWALFFFGLSFGFVRFYKENLFRQNSESTEHYQLQQVRRLCFWAYQKSVMIKLKLCFSSKDTKQYRLLQRQLNQYADLHTQMLKLENQFCKKIKHIDVDSYLDEML